jgi:hypothetical protein
MARPVLLALVALIGACSGDRGRGVVIDERDATYRGIGLGSPEADVVRVFGEGQRDGGIAPVGKLPAQVGVPAVIAPPRAALPWAPRLRRYERAAFLFAGGRVFTMMLTDDRLQTSTGVSIGDEIEEVRSRYRDARCRQVAGGESLFGGQKTYPVCHIQIGADRVLYFGGDPIRSFTFYTRSLE